MFFFQPRVIRTNLILLIVFVVIINVDCRPGGRGKVGRIRAPKLFKNKLHSNTFHQQSSLLRKPANHILVSGGSAGLIIGGTLALRAFIINNKKKSIESRHLLTNGTGNLCINRENYSNFIFNEFRCPLYPIYKTNDHYCCGTYEQQYCCSFWESGGRAIGAIIGIISACSLFILFIICCIVYYRRYLKRKGINREINTQQISFNKRSIDMIPSESPPPYSEVIINMNNHLLKWILFLLIMLLSIEGKGIGGSRGGGGFKGGNSRGSGTFGGSSNYNRGTGYRSNMGKPHSGSSFKSKAISFAAGAAGGIAAYSLMRQMSGSYHSRPGYYGPGYGVGETCTNNEDLNGTVFGEFRCPLNGFPYEAKYCCGEYGKQFCCIREQNRFSRSASHFGWIVIVIVILLIIIILWARRNRQRQNDMKMIPTEPPMNEQYHPSPFYQPPPPTAGYPPPPGPNPYGVPPQNFNPYSQQYHPQPYNPY